MTLNPESPNKPNTLDKNKSAYKLLLPDMSKLDILYITNHISQIITDLEDTCKKLTLLFLDEHNSEYNDSYYNELLNNSNSTLTIVRDNPSSLPFSSATFDAVIIDESIVENNLIDNGHIKKSNIYNPSTKKNENIYFLDEVKRILNSSGWIFLKVNNKLSRHQIINKVKKIANKDNGNTLTLNSSYFTNKSTNYLLKLLRSFDLKPVGVHSFDQTHETIDNIINLYSDKQIKTFKNKSKGKLKYYPIWAYRLTSPAIGILAFNGQQKKILINIIIEEIISHCYSSTNTWHITSFETNSKSKTIIAVDIDNTSRHKLIIKVPLSKLSKAHIIHSYEGLSYINRYTDSKLFPSPIISSETSNISYTVETQCSGTPWLREKGNTDIGDMINQLTDVFLELKKIELPSMPPNDQVMLRDKVDAAENYLKINSPEMIPILKKLFLPLIDNESQTGRKFFYKSDFSVSNILVKNKRIKGIIDLDFWGSSHNSLVDYADFIISFSRNFNGIDPDESLLYLFKCKFERLPTALNINSNLIKMESTSDELKNAALITWMNSIYHVLEFGTNTEKMNKMLLLPLERLSSCINNR